MPGRSVMTALCTAAAAVLLQSAGIPAGAAGERGNRPPGQKVSGQPAAGTVDETDQLQFQPVSVTIARGQAVEWTNAGSVPHNVTFDRYPTLTSDRMGHGDRHEIRFTVAGTYQYRCTYHPGMAGSVTVSP